MPTDDSVSPIVTPWRTNRDLPHPVVRNVSDEPLIYARAMIRVGDRTITEHWGTILPGDENEICLCGVDVSDTCVTLSWRGADVDTELLWQFVF